MPPRAFTLALLLLTASILPGCNAVTTAGDIVGSTFDVASEVVTAGKANTFVAVPWETVEASVRNTGQLLAVKLVKDEPFPEKHKKKITFYDDRDQKIVITIVRRSSNMTELRVDVSLWGPNELAKLTLNQILRGIPETAHTTRATTLPPPTTAPATP